MSDISTPVPGTPRARWPKTFPALTPEQVIISDDFVKHWHEVLPRRFGLVDRFNHSYPVKHSRPFTKTLEIGAGIGEHLNYEVLTPEQEKNYVAVDIRENMAAEIRRLFPKIQGITGDCQKRLPFDDGNFDRIVAIHVLEHLPNLPAAVAEMYRLCDKSIGYFSIVIPCEGSFAYSLARKISAQRIFEKKYGQSYRWFIEREHINLPAEIFAELDPYFERVHVSHFPIPVPLTFCNLCIGATFVPRPQPLL